MEFILAQILTWSLIKGMSFFRIISNRPRFIEELAAFVAAPSLKLKVSRRFNRANYITLPKHYQTY